MSFASSFGPWLAVATALVGALLMALDRARRARAIRRLLAASGTGEPAPTDQPSLLFRMASTSRGRARGKAVLWISALTLTALAVARPQVTGQTSWKRTGIDIAVIMDFSKSMLAEDIYPNRLERTREEVEELLDELESDRVAIVIFAGAAAHFPLTHDHQAARSLFRGVGPQDLPPGSDLGEAIRVGRCIIRPAMADDPGCGKLGGRGDTDDTDDDDDDDDEGDDAASSDDKPDDNQLDGARALVIFTDGEETEDGAIEQVEQAVLLGIDVFIVGVGTQEGELVPEVDSDGNKTGWKKSRDGKSFVTTRLDLEALASVAEVAGGEDHMFVLDPKRFRAADLIDQLKRLKRADRDERVVNTPRDVYHWFLFPAFMLLIIEACFTARRRRMVYFPDMRDERRNT